VNKAQTSLLFTQLIVVSRLLSSTTSLAVAAANQAN
jgi:hypothetical protein